MAYQFAIRLTTCPNIKNGQSYSVVEKGSPKSAKESESASVPTASPARLTSKPVAYIQSA